MAQTTEIRTGRIGHAEGDEQDVFQGVPLRRTREIRPRGKRILLLILAALGLVGLAVGGVLWSRRGLVTVQTGKVTRQDLAATVTASGEIKPPPDKFATVNANSSGKVTEILVKEGDHVRKGQLLLRTEDIQQEADVRGQQAALTSARADAQAARAAVESASASLRTAEANLTQAQAKYTQAKGDFSRAQELFKEQLIARQEFDQDLSNYEVADAGVTSAKAQVVQAKAQLSQATYNRDMAHARVMQAQAQLIGSQDVRNRTIYTSPFDGVITSLPVHVGENVVPGIQNQVGSVLFQVSDLSVITAEVDVDESDIISVHRGQPADVAIDAIPDKVFKGHVTEIGMSALGATTGSATTSSTTSSTTGEAKDFKVVVTLDDPPPGLRPGLSATAKITTATRHNAVTIPIQALSVRDRRELETQKNKNTGGNALAAKPENASPGASGNKELQGVFTVRNGRAVFVMIKTGIMGTTRVEVLNGLKPGEEIVTGSFQVLRTLKNNAKVRVNNHASNLGPPPS